MEVKKSLQRMFYRIEDKNQRTLKDFEDGGKELKRINGYRKIIEIHRLMIELLLFLYIQIRTYYDNFVFT